VATPSSLPSYDPRVIEQFAENLYRKASAFVVGSVAIGAALGAAFGAVPLTSLGDSWPIPSVFGFATLLVGGIVGALIGYVIGDTRSFGYRLQAQSALCQLQTERNTAALAQAVLAARRAQARPAQTQAAAPAPQPQPAQPPAPAPPAPPVPQRQPSPPPAVDPALAPEPPVSPPVSAARVA
jgi:hypothetical protein